MKDGAWAAGQSRRAGSWPRDWDSKGTRSTTKRVYIYWPTALKARNRTLGREGGCDTSYAVGGMTLKRGSPVSRSGTSLIEIGRGTKATGERKLGAQLGRPAPCA